MRRTYRTSIDCKMQHNAEVGLFTEPSRLLLKYLCIVKIGLCVNEISI
jgi:hypothetical protein